MKKWISKRIEGIVAVVAKKIREGEVELDKELYFKNRMARIQAEEEHRRAVKKTREDEERRHREILEAAEAEALEREKLAAFADRTRKNREEARRQRKLKKEQERREHQEAVRRAKAAIKKVKKDGDVPLYKKMEERYREKVVLPEIQKRNQTLKERKQVNAPLDMQSILENERQYLRQSGERGERAKLLARSIIENRETSDKKKYYHGRAWKLTQEEDTEMRLARKKESQVRQMIERKRQYGKLVKEMFLPSIDPLKRNEIAGKREMEQDRKKFIERTKTKRADMNSRAWRIENEDVLAAERQRIRAKRRKEKKEAEERKRRTKSAPDYLSICIKRGRKKSKTKKDLEDLGKMNQNVEQLEKETHQRTRTLRKRSDRFGNIGAVEEETDLYIRLAKEKIKLLSRVQQNSR
mmetsp:Transcript_26390/g.36799  ORF Transcript_26390/g.36799 Transcript_26390/m.36799 type:complete len:411 (-) Transcript_26390:224-1456(-)|eukprot:CAMPEP_0184490184 /NCGR_PEP_ID=MMETSP0113_2-20130426/17226_1 /TAXON_ID=91329 /ORGANISM="Norrisiella sphaerica, Strain BC52" /LENGTH=410 /DNA_ID=CAMNT_0026873947 /DNA_START=42 /DNA_END=1274 /DNA_ORIENTATION=+